MKTSSTNGNTEETTTTQQIQPNEITVKQRLNSPNKKHMGRETKKRKKKNKKQKQKENSKVEDKAVVSVIWTFILYPILSPWRILLDLIRLAMEIISSTIRLVQQKLSRKRQINITPKRKKTCRYKKKKKKKKMSSKLQMFRRQYLNRRFFQNIFLLCHVLKEVYVILSLLRSYWISPDVSSIHRANTSLALGLVGANLFWNKKYPRNDFASKVLFWILSQYHLTSLSVSLMINGGQHSINSFVQQSDKSGTRSFYWSFFDGITNENWYDLYVS